MLRLAKSLAKTAVMAGAGPFVLAALWLRESFRPVRIGYLISERIGHLAMNTDLFLRRRQLGEVHPMARHVFLADAPANRQLLDMFKRHLTILEEGWPAKLLKACLPLLRPTRFFVELPFRSREYREMSSTKATLAFTEEEEARGREGLARMGIGPDDWFVCFHARDSSYLRKERPGEDWDYHSYRDCDTRNFLPAARYVAERGGFALRMGSVVDGPLPGSGPRIIDYASNFRDEFMDVYLLAKCKFMLGSDTGLPQVSTIFDVPVVNTNVPMVDWASFREGELFIQKKVFDEELGRVLTYAEIIERDYGRYYDSKWLKSRRLKLIENTGEEILDAAREMDERIDGRWVPPHGAEAMQKRYRLLFSPSHRCFGFRSRIGTAFLLKNKRPLFGDD